MRCLLIAALAVLASAAPAEAAVRRPPLPSPMPAMFSEPCPDYHPAPRGCAVSPGDRDLTGRQWLNGAVFVRSGTSHYVLLHELGHIYDDRYLDDSERRAFARAIDRPRSPWRVIWKTAAGPIQSPDSLAEIMADAYANCRMGHVRARHHAWSTDFDYYPTQPENRRACRVLTVAGLTIPGPPKGVTR